MIKEAPSLGRMLAMTGFAFSCVCLLLFLWLQFGGSLPLRAESYRFKAQFDEAALLVKQADVRIAGLNVGKVVNLEPKDGRGVATIEIEPRYGPIPKDTRVILRQKALLGETYIELTPGDKSAGTLDDGETLAFKATQEAVQIDELVRTFDRPTRRAFQGWIRELAGAIEKGRGEDLNNAIGNLPDFVATGDDVLAVLDDQRPALQALIRNSGRTLEAVNEREGQLRQLVVNGDRFFGALASRNEALADTVFVLPTFLDETRLTVRRLRRFSVNARPLVRDLQPVATDLKPTLRDVGRLAPDLRALFRDLSPLIDESEDTLPRAARFLRGAEPVFESLHTYLPELNPILSFANFQQGQLADFFTNGGGSLNATLPPINASEGPRHYLRQFGAINARGLGTFTKRPDWERANAYPGPNYLKRMRRLGITEAFDCAPAGGTKRNPSDASAPCFVQPKSLFDGRQFPRLRKGGSPLRNPPPDNLGSAPANP